ncbi:hypothetical protein [Tepidiforma thermophila]|uniref:Uncharacterized protein n=1 Tax=Tepidiforma thermophila (strain KCTC 52669 / CGMCC 1.13589 / G233) TaxID=2761530 RepID=A0A2A9HJZ8_TEPT2|nr:hypothetical protein [Tepidiforma thermophila]PFG75316.1 hypothetical protein A9A59_2584 [Tepidiforma thermophila]
MAGQRQKAVELLQFHRGGRDRALVVYDDGDRTVPPLPRGCGRVGAVARQAWRELWSSPVREVLDRRADGAVLREYVLLVDERERLWTCMAAGERMAPVVARMAQAERQVQKLRKLPAPTPLARFRLQQLVLGKKHQLRQPAAPAELPEPPAAVELDDIPEPWRPSGG